MKNNKMNLIKRIIVLILTLIFAGIMVFSGYKIIDYTKDTIETKEVEDEVQEFIKQDDNDSESFKVDFRSLKEINKDTVGWLTINDTNVNYPVVQANNNQYYLDHNFKKNYNGSGWLFADYRDKMDGKDKNVVIYGHSMKNKTMFGQLSKVLKKDWYEKEDNLNIKFYTEKSTITYRVFSIYKIEAEDYYINTDFKNNNEFTSFVKEIKKRSIINLDTDTSKAEQVLTLSTCYDNNNIRLVVHAVKVEETTNDGQE